MRDEQPNPFTCGSQTVELNFHAARGNVHCPHVDETDFIIFRDESELGFEREVEPMVRADAAQVIAIRHRPKPVFELLETCFVEVRRLRELEGPVLAILQDVLDEVARVGRAIGHLDDHGRATGDMVVPCFAVIGPFSGWCGAANGEFTGQVAGIAVENDHLHRSGFGGAHAGIGHDLHGLTRGRPRGLLHRREIEAACVARAVGH